MHGDSILVFNHVDFPSAGLQVPAGTVEYGETVDAAVIREAQEETGLMGLEVRSYLGSDELDLVTQGERFVVRRHFYHLQATESVPDTWRHWENDPSGSDGTPIEFDFYWHDLKSNMPELSGNQGAYLADLVRSLGLSSEIR